MDLLLLVVLLCFATLRRHRVSRAWLTLRWNNQQSGANGALVIFSGAPPVRANANVAHTSPQRRGGRRPGLPVYVAG